ncbi:TetR/AcrR family transcriptional regulator [Nocardia fluminea]|uniref:TetR family transcriptional regulator n=1 Tax=Nocardia fluminea TaxID=134984 RepID=A0A2N3WYU1_9NOCA|nr:TetR/AcrR family transcriptional regulator [Nocardia fluminea]PKV99030.1 TetR family transcriptional regulator [Nocardia fluminea]
MDAPSRPMRADARRNYERIVDCARDAFAEHGTDAPLDDIARRAGVGPGTLYRHFPNRTTLMEAVYRSNIETLAARAGELRRTHAPLDAFDAWFGELVTYILEKHGLATTLKAAIDRTSDTFTACSTLLAEAAGSVLIPVQEAGIIRPEVSPRDILRLGHGIGAGCQAAADSAPLLTDVALAGLRVQR